MRENAVRSNDFLKKLIVFASILALTVIGLAAPNTCQFVAWTEGDTTGETVWNVVPRMEWALSREHSGLHAFTFGEGLYEFTFAPINAENMQYLEFDIYLPGVEVVSQWKSGETEFEITSSGTCDIQEYAWSGWDLWEEAIRNGLKLEAGWNHIRLNLPKQSSVAMSRINYIRWYWSETGEGRTAAGCQVANLKFTVENGKDPANAHLEPFIPFTRFATEDVPVALADVTSAPYNADPTGVMDSTNAIQDALYDVSLNGGGTVWMPAGRYRITGKIQIPSYVTLRGDWADPDTVSEYGTLIALDIPEEDRNDTGTFMLGGCGGVYGLTLYYPNQSLHDIRAYPFAFYVDGRIWDSYIMPSVINCTILNGYRGIGAATWEVSNPEETGHENMYVINFRGTFLNCGAESYNESDFGFWDDVKIRNQYWISAARTGILPPVDPEALDEYTKAHATGMIFGDLEWVSLNNITVEDCMIGIHTVRGKRDEIEFQGILYGITTENCTKGVVVNALNVNNGMVLANSSISGGLYNTTGTVIRMFNVEVNGEKKGRLREDDDYSLKLSATDGDFGYSKPRAVLYTANLDSSGRTDVAGELQALLDRAGATGGVVYLPGGVYRVDTPINVPAGVELKGTSAVPTRDFPHGCEYNGTTLLSYYLGSGPDDRALVTLNGKGAGLNGIRINFPENRIRTGIYDSDLYGTGFAVRGKASHVYIVNSYIVGSSYGVDFTQCDRHCVRNLAGACFKNTIKVGGKNGVVSNCFQNPGMYFISSTPYVVLPQGNAHTLYEAVSRNFADYLILDHACDELVYNIALFGAHNTLTNIDSENTTVVNMGSDYMAGTQIVMDGGSMTVVNAMRWDGRSFRHEKGSLRIYNRFEHGFSSGLNGDAIEETYVAEK